MENELLKKLNTLNENSSIKDIQEYANKMIEERGFEDETPQDILMLLFEAFKKKEEINMKRTWK